MEERIVAPIGLVVGIITSCTERIEAGGFFGLNHQIARQESLYKKFHLPVQGRSPPLIYCG